METGEQGEAAKLERLLGWRRLEGRARLLGWRRLIGPDTTFIRMGSVLAIIARH